jgi:alpha-D-ribose 1-methylphosphonate 5-triphosphate diphosphatase
LNAARFYPYEAIVTTYAVFTGTVAVRDGLIADVPGGSGAATVVDWEGDYLIPGLLEIHTDNLEHNVMPRPAVLWPVSEAIIARDPRGRYRA